MVLNEILKLESDFVCYFRKRMLDSDSDNVSSWKVAHPG